MAETINVPYVDDLQGGADSGHSVLRHRLLDGAPGSRARGGCIGLPKDECPNPWRAVRLRWYLLLPLVALVVLLFSGYTPLFSGTVGLALTVVLIFGAAVSSALSRRAVRGLFWVAAGAGLRGLLRSLASARFLSIVALLVACSIRAAGGDARTGRRRAWSTAPATRCRSASPARWWA